VAARRWLAGLRSYRFARLAWLALLPQPPPDQNVISAFSSLAMFAFSRPFAPENFARPFELKLRGVPVVMQHPIPADVIARAHARFSTKLGEMLDLCREAGVPVLLVQPVRNLQSSFYLRFHIAPSEIQPGRIAEWRIRYEQGLAQIEAGRYGMAIDTLRSVRELYVEDRDEILAFQIGRCLERLGRIDDALAEYEQPYLRHPVRGLIAEVAAAHDVPLVDPYPALVARSTGGIPGFDEFTDGFHPMPITNRVIAECIAATLAERGLLGTLRDPAAPASAAARGRLDQLVARLQPPLHNRMTAAMAAGDYRGAIAAADEVPRDELLDTQIVESVLLGWALVRAGEVDRARELHAALRSRYWGADRRLPPLETDADLVRYVFAGDLFAWF
jgi:tetratricopeptide (TPR) repeat protein